MSNSDQIKLAIDIGGTFTDTVLMRGENQIIATTKTPTTPNNPEKGALAGAKHVFHSSGTKPENVDLFVHGTTLATNALIERRGAKVATILTEGFRDILSIGYERRYSQYDINIEKPDLIVPRSHSFVVPERMSFEGDVLEPLDMDFTKSICAKIAELDVEAIAVCLLHSYANPIHEQYVAELLTQKLPGVSISISSDVSPEAREFDRLCTTIANAYIQPLMGTYLSSLSNEFVQLGIQCPILMMTASGGMTSLKNAAALPIRLVESGPAGGAILAANTAFKIGAQNVLSFDMGGTTAKLCLIDGYKPQTTRKFEISRAERFIKGSGMPVRIPVIEMIEIGAGGGSIATVDRLGRLQVGPRSAGSEPGPAAFDNGGVEPTVTDADFNLGYIDAAEFAEGQISLSASANEEALSSYIGDQLAIGLKDAAIGVSEIVDENMASAARMHAVESGKDLGERTMIAFGGNGPLHASRVARRAGIQTILIPPNPGVGSAVGFLYAPISYEIVRSRYTVLRDIDVGAIDKFLKDMENDAREIVETAAGRNRLFLRRSAFMRYQGQGHELEIELPSQSLGLEIESKLQEAFELEYQRQFTRIVPGMTIEILNWGLTVSTSPAFESTPVDTAITEIAKPVGHRKITCDLTGEEITARIHQRRDLLPGMQILSPALICEPQTVTLVSADFAAVVDSGHNLLLTKIADRKAVS